MTRTYDVLFRSEARADLREIYEGIAAQSGPLTAFGFVQKLEDYCSGLALFPSRGVVRPGLRPGLHLAFFNRQATIAYLIDDERNRVVIMHIFGAGRDFVSLLREEK